MKYLIALIFLGLIPTAFSNTRIQDLRTIVPEDIFGKRELWGLDFKVGGDLSSGNTERKILNTNLSLYRRWDKLTGYIDGSLNYLSVSENPSSRIVNVGAATLRLDYSFTTSLKWFFFSTHAYNENLAIDYRSTEGFGIWKDLVYKNLNNAVSFAAVYEKENYKTAADDDNIRLALRNILTYKLSSHSKVLLDAFYVPKANEFSDYRTFASLTLASKVYKDNIGIEFTASHEKDSKPPVGVLKNDISLSSKATFHFGE